MKKFILITISFFCIIRLSAQPDYQVLQEEHTKLGRLLYAISNQYVDTVTLHKFVEKMVVNTLQQLDPHSTYISAEDVDASNEPFQGSFDGIGVEFNILNDTLIVINAVSGGPSELVGIRSGDRIIKVGEENIAGVGLKNQHAFKLLRGPKGTKVELGIQRKDVKELLIFVVTRDKIPIHSVDVLYEISPGIVFVRLNKFAVTSVEEVRSGLAKLKNKPKAMILDLRSNSGGVLPVAIDLADQFFEADKLLLYNEGANWRQAPDMSTGNGFFKEGKLAILIDEYSASASEIVSGAVQDWDRGVIIGRRSFGKGLVQQSVPLPDGSLIRLTVARYHTPTGRAIQR
ncbi:MAG: PDZ domain-containing protein, partial [Prevotellaceae bacterium]|nr:PDZ domain-containing protein [Prevotellaceae bacterium]